MDNGIAAELEGKVAVVTGAGSRPGEGVGNGRAAASACAASRDSATPAASRCSRRLWMLSTITPMNRFSTTKVATRMNGRKNSSAKGCCSIAGFTMFAQSSSVMSWNRVKRLAPSVPNCSSIVAP